VAIVRRAFLLAVGWTGAVVHVEDDRPRRGGADTAALSETLIL
jgi:hypothetical protein